MVEGKQCLDIVTYPRVEDELLVLGHSVSICSYISFLFTRSIFNIGMK